ncbi:uncharacterized protein LOC124819076 [Hydra vulgaris]|uniref:uncharacterized protein LOC124819076 n=1 Tax=Hydra vulgaris TaxID=6087 RepID=UPI001F5FCD11|nr:uncharacterized protein LOC124819076 [Hydra vulgaris]
MSLLFKVTNVLSKLEEPRTPYSYRTHKKIYNLPGQYFHCDLADMSVFNTDKKVYRRNYCIVLVDGVSGFVRFKASIGKSAREILVALKSLFEHMNRQEEVFLQTDRGGEFYNKQFEAWCNENKITHFSSKNLQKAYLAENAIRRLKDIYQKLRIAKKLTDKTDWTSFLPLVEEKLNKSKRTVSGITPE